jgi:hypothetical protein
MDGIVREFALQMLRKLQSRPIAEKELLDGQINGDTHDQDENMEDGQLPTEGPEDLVQTAYLPEQIELPAQKSHVLQHVELLFALSVKVPEFLEECVHSILNLSLLFTLLCAEFSRLMAEWISPSRKLFNSLSLHLSNRLVPLMASF